MLVNLTRGQTLAERVSVCDTFWSRLGGLMFRPAIGADEAWVFCHRRESISDTSIHMFFVFFPIAVVWLDAHRCVVDKALARPFRPYYASQVPAQYFVEGAPALLNLAEVGDELSWEGVMP
jgi:uncharacterized membrane protein (UPF0127 family)